VVAESRKDENLVRALMVWRGKHPEHRGVIKENAVKA